MPVVRIPTPLRPYAGGKDTAEAAGSTVGDVLNALVAELPELKERILDGGEVRRFVNIYVNNEDIRYLDDLATPVADRSPTRSGPAMSRGISCASGRATARISGASPLRGSTLPSVKA